MYSWPPWSSGVACLLTILRSWDLSSLWANLQNLIELKFDFTITLLILRLKRLVKYQIWSKFQDKFNGKVRLDLSIIDSKI